MKLSLLQENLSTSLTLASHFVASKVQLPILSHLLVKTDSGRLKISATNLELGLSCFLGAKIDVEGEFTVPAHEITEFVSYLPKGPLSLTLDSQNLLEVKSAKAQSTFTTQPTLDFPSLPTLGSDTCLDLDLAQLTRAVAQVAFAAAQDDSRPVLTAVLCRFASDSLSLVATDGFRLSLKHLQLSSPVVFPASTTSLTFLIPARTLFEVAKLSKTAKTIKMGTSGDSHQLVFVLEDLELVSRLIEGDFPDYQKIIPETFTTKIHLNRDEFSQAIKLASVFARESANVVKLNIRSNSVDLSASTPQVGQNKVSLDARVEGEPLEVAFNYKFVSDFLSSCQGEEITIELNQPLTPVLFRDTADVDFTHIIMPVRIQD